MSETPSADAKQRVDEFRAHWQSATMDNNLTLYGFRRFKTTHLLNLRFLESEIAKLDHKIYQAGLSLNLRPSPQDRLGLRHSKRDDNVPQISKTIDEDFVARLQGLLQKYDEAIFAFNKMMTMETFCLLDDQRQSSARTDLTLLEMHKTRLLRVDLESRTRLDPVQVQIRRWLRAFRYWRFSRRMLQTSNKNNTAEMLEAFPTGFTCSYQDTTFLATLLSRLIAVLVTGAFLVIPLAILSHQQPKSFQLLVVTVFILIFAFLAAIMFKMSNLELMVVSAAYSAVLSVFVSNVTTN